MASTEGNTVITAQDWGSVDGQTVKKYTLKNEKNEEVAVISYGATVVSVKTADCRGNIEDVVLGFDDITGYLAAENPYFGATVGRVANRIAKGRFTLDGVVYQVSQNVGENSLHGGKRGWSSKVWNSSIQNNSVVMTLLSEDGDEGYPGAVVASVVFAFTNSGELTIEMKAFGTKATPINLTNHSYFNLAGHGGNASELYKHRVTLNADRWTVTDSQSIPTGQIESVAGSVLDLRNATTIGDVINKVPIGGYDYNFCLPQEVLRTGGQKFAAKVEHPASGRVLEVYTNQPGVQFYTSNFLPQINSTGILGKNGKRYFRHGAFCLETQNYPDAVNHPNFPNSILRPGHMYHHTVLYKFGVQA